MGEGRGMIWVRVLGGSSSSSSSSSSNSST